jgi:hypothetical protein
MLTVNKSDQIGRYTHENELDDQMSSIVGQLIDKNIQHPIAVALNPKNKKY